MSVQPQTMYLKADWQEHVDFLDTMKQDVQNWERYCARFAAGSGEPPPNNIPDPEDVRAHGRHSDDPKHFEQLTRRTTSKKAKKLESLSTSLDGDDWHHFQVITGKATAPRKPPYGKTWMKQLFAGQMGLSILCVIAGMVIGVPLDVTSSNWDASTSARKRLLHNDLQKEDPYCLVITQPCGPWGNWSRFNLARGGQHAITIEELRKDGRHILRLVNKTIVDRVKAKRHVFVEQPRLEEPELEGVRKLLDSGDRIPLRVDGCQVGYHDAQSGLPHMKPSRYVTSMLAAESVFQHRHCPHDHQHEHLEGRNAFGSRTLQAAEWPQELNKLVYDLILQQAAIENTATVGIAEAYPAEVRPAEQQAGRTPKRRKKGRMATLTSQYGAPPVYIRPPEPTEPELPAIEEDEEQHDPLPAVAPGDDTSARAIQAHVLDPILNLSAQERRRRWLNVEPGLRKTLRDLHTNFGHPTNATLQRLLRRQKAKMDAITAVDYLACDICGDSIRRRRPRPVRLPGRYIFNHHLQIDVFYARDSVGEQFSFLNIICEATGFQVVSCLGNSPGPPATKAVLRHFLTTWSSWAGLPQSIQVDRGKEYMLHFSNYLKEFGVEQEIMPLEAPWKNGKVEKAGHLWKEIFYKVVREMQLAGLEDVVLATSIVTQCRNAFPRSYGYAPNQWVLGTPQVRLPGSLLQEDEALPTDGGQPHSYWLRYGGSVVLVTGEQLWFAREDELLAAHLVPQELLEPSYIRGARNYADLRLHLPPPPEHQQIQGLHGASITPEGVNPSSASAPPSTAADAHHRPQLTQAAQTRATQAHLQPVPETTDLDMDDSTQQEERTGQVQPPFQHVPETPPIGFTPNRTTIPPDLNSAMNQPDRLDGHPEATFRPVRTEREPLQGPYMVEEDIWDCPTFPSVIRERNLKRLAKESGYTSDSNEEVTEDEQAMNDDPADAFLTGKAARSTDIKLHNLSKEDREKFNASMAKEWASWQRFNAVELLTPKQVKELPEDVQIVGTKWVHTDKNDRPRLLAVFLSKRTGKTKEQIKKEFPFEAKSRMVVMGHLEEGNNIRSDSPTASLLAFNIVSAVAVMKGWTIVACDASTAYLQSQGISRLLVLRPPRPPPPGVSPHDLFRARGSIYGTKDAGRAWWKKLYKTLKAHEWTMSHIEPALFYHISDFYLSGILITHVDDLYCAGEGDKYEETISSMEKEIHLKVKRSEFRFCGKNIVQKNGNIEIDQYDAIEGIEYMIFNKTRRQQVNAPLNEQEKTQFRGLIGQMGWITRQSRPDLMVNVSMASQSMGAPKVKDVIQLNKAVKMLKETADAKWKFKTSNLRRVCLHGLQLREHRAAKVTMWLCAWPHQLRDEGWKRGAHLHPRDL